ncbi:hypothetical protein [Nonomuraea typhae]|uniref:hypothetical protein n=1 Tax=Nonomuraea typhae TaxID=2603600 RepID=UPI0012FCE00C|nr:hypothetical protein [Nonomuraea typhae]
MIEIVRAVSVVSPLKVMVQVAVRALEPYVGTTVKIACQEQHDAGALAVLARLLALQMPATDPI